MSDDITSDEYWAQVDAELAEAAENHVPRCQPWTPEEAELVRRYYGRVDIHILAEKLGRTRGSVTNYAQRLGLPRCR